MLSWKKALKNGFAGKSLKKVFVKKGYVKDKYEEMKGISERVWRVLGE